MHCLLFFPHAFVNQRQARVSCQAGWVEARHADPALNGFVHVAILHVQLGGVEGSLGGPLQVSQSLVELGELFIGDRVVRQDCRRAQVAFQCAFVILHFKERQPKIRECLGMIG